MLVRVRILGEFCHRDWHIMRASLRPLCGRAIYRDPLREEIQTAEVTYARIIGSIRMCGSCIGMLIRATEDATRDCQRIECFISNECECVARALDPKGV